MTAGLAGAALLLTFLFHLDVAAVAVAILAAVPAFYLAWRALPDSVEKPSYGERARDWKPGDLGVHRVRGGGPMPPYIRRRHDDLLAAVLDPADRASRLVVLRGESATGKSRAAYQGVTDRLADWLLDYPQDPGTLAARLDAGLRARTVLWLGELRHYADTDGGMAVAARLADLIAGEGHLVITTVWPEHWEKYAAAARAGPGDANPMGAVGRLLARLPDLTKAELALIDPARGGVIDVPQQFTRDDMDAAEGTGDVVLAEAVLAVGESGRVTQYLAAVPALLKRYADDHSNPYGHKVITAAMDAARLGHAGLLPAELVLHAAVGYLTDLQRTQPLIAWAQPALDWATAELDGAVRALQPVPPAAGTGVAGYRIADYLDQHGRRARLDQPGLSSLWNALITYTTSPADLDRLGQAAEGRGLYRHAAALWTKGTSLGSAHAARQLISLLRTVSPDDVASAIHWIAQVCLDAPEEVVWELMGLRAEGAAQILAEMVAKVSLDNGEVVAGLLEQLRAARADTAAHILTERAAAEADCDDWWRVINLLRGLREAGAYDAARALAERAAAQNPGSGEIGSLPDALRAAGADDAARALVKRAAAQTRLDEPGNVAYLLKELRYAAADDAVQALLNRDPATQVSLDDPGQVAHLLKELRYAVADDAVQALLNRDPAAQVSLDWPRCDPDGEYTWGIANLLEELHIARADDAAQVLAMRAAAAQVSLDEPQRFTRLLVTLHEAKADTAVWALAERAIGQFGLDNPEAGAWLVFELRTAGADDTARVCAERAAARASFDNPGGVARLAEELRAVGADARARVLAEQAATQACLDDPGGVAALLRELREVEADRAAQALIERAVVEADLDDPRGVAELLRELRTAEVVGAAQEIANRAAAQASLHDLWGVSTLVTQLRTAETDEAARIFTKRAAAQASLDDPQGVADLLGQLHQSGADEAVHILLNRDPASHVSVNLDSGSGPIFWLQEMLSEIGADTMARTLAERAANAGGFRLLLHTCLEEATNYQFGREPDGTPTPCWNWQKPTEPAVGPPIN